VRRGSYSTAETYFYWLGPYFFVGRSPSSKLFNIAQLRLEFPRSSRTFRRASGACCRFPRSHKRDPAFAHRHPGPRLIGVAWCLGHYRVEPPYCAASLVARAAIDYTAALFFVLREAMEPRPKKPSSIIAHVDGSGTAEKLSCVCHCAPHIEYRTRASTSVATITATRKRQSIDIGCPLIRIGDQHIIGVLCSNVPEQPPASATPCR
jgi:hypothetical protein